MKVERQVTASAALLAFEGRLDSSWSEPASQALEDAIRSGRPRIELDLSKVSFLSSVGLGVVLRAVGRFRSVGGTLVIVAASEPVREMLRVAKLEPLLGSPASAAPASGATTAIGSGWTGELTHLSEARAAARCVEAGTIVAARETLAIGHLALAADARAAAGLFGDGLVAGGTIAVSPADAPRPDCLASGEDRAVRCVGRDAVVVEGPFACRGSFEWSGALPVPVTSLATALVAALEGPVAFVAIGENFGAYGAWARTSPDRWTKPIASMGPSEMRGALRFAGEPILRGESLCVVAIATDAGRREALAPDVAASLAEVNASVGAGVEGGIALHAHAAVVAYRPVPRSVTDVAAAGALLAEQPLRSVMHALVGPGGEETSFVRGSFWAMRIGGAR